MQSVSSIAAQLLEETGRDTFDFREYFDTDEDYDFKLGTPPSIDNGDKVVNHVKNLLNEVIDSVISEEDYEESNEIEPTNENKNKIKKKKK